ncbi:MAG: LOG family protein [Candidatus Colwellbacteria bacterium]|nr:LOG family protein [Candidatus Colwellbacteria bacterium]
MPPSFYDGKYKICVSGAAETVNCGEEAFSIAEELGREIIRHNGILIDGATTGFPYWSAKGAKSIKGGIVVGLSPAMSEKEHVEIYKLPVDYHDLIVYTGFNYSGRNLLLTRASDAVIVGCGRMGTLNEFTIAFEDKKPIGILRGPWETDEVLLNMMEKSHRAEEMKDKIVISENPKELLDKLIKVIDAHKNEIIRVL